jgi:hypothetical protein
MQELFGHDPDFANLMGQMKEMGGDQEMPPVHPGKQAEISDEEVQANIDRKTGRNMFDMRGKFRSQYGLFDMSDAEQREELENMVNNCLQKKWLMAREEWQHLQDGRTMVSIKCLVPDDKPKKKASSDEDV